MAFVPSIVLFLPEPAHVTRRAAAARGRPPAPAYNRRRPASVPSTFLRAAAMPATTISRIRATPVTVPLEAPLRHSNGAHWGRFVRTIVEVETADGYLGLRRDGRRRRGRVARLRRARGLPRRPRRVRARGDAPQDLQPDREPLQQPHAAARRARVRLPRHHRQEARRPGARAARRQAERPRRLRELPVLPLRRPGDGRRAKCARPTSWSRTRASSRRSTASARTS